MKRTVVDQIEITQDNTVQVRLKKQIVDGDAAHDIGYHRTLVPAGGDVEAQFAQVNAHLEAMNCAPVSAADVARVKAHAAVAA